MLNQRFGRLDLPPTLVQGLRNFSGMVSLVGTCPERWTSLMRNLPSFQTTGELAGPMVFISSIGVLLPMALCGRSSLYSLLKASHFD